MEEDNNRGNTLRKLTQQKQNRKNNKQIKLYGRRLLIPYDSIS